MTDTLTLRVKGEYFDAIKSGEKTFEYRLVTGYWARRIIGRDYKNVIVTKGYPKRDDTSRIMKFPWRGYTNETITHPHFGDKPVKVFSIRVGE